MDQVVKRQETSTLRVTQPPFPENWVLKREGVDLDVLVVGGGQSGMAIGWALRQAGITRIEIVESGPADSVGMWNRTARMPILRTPKTVTGPELGHEQFGYPHWHDAVHGAGSFSRLTAIATDDWISYLAWYRQATESEITFETTLTGIRRTGDHFIADLAHGEGRSQRSARKIVFATGFAGCGGIFAPDFLTRELPEERYGHSGSEIDFTLLRGKDIAIIGGAASAFDAAAAALEAGSRHVDLLCRRAEIPAASPGKQRAFPGAQDNFHLLPDQMRWNLAIRMRELGMNPPLHAIERVIADPRFDLRLGAGIESIAFDGEKVHIRTLEHVLAVDHVIAATGYVHDLSRDPVLCDLAPLAFSWGDQIAGDNLSVSLAKTPYLSAHFALVPNDPLHAWLGDIHIFSPAAALSHGRPVGDAPSLSKLVPLLVSGISRDLFMADIHEHENRLFAEPQRDYAPEALERMAIGRSSFVR